MKKEKEKKKEKKRGKRAEEEILLPQEASTPTRPPLEYALSLVGGRWKMRILLALSEKKELRYGEIRQRVKGITDMMLSQSLRELLSDGLLDRVQYQEIPPRVEYSLTKDGISLLPVLEAFSAWSVQLMKKRGL